MKPRRQVTTWRDAEKEAPTHAEMVHFMDFAGELHTGRYDSIHVRIYDHNPGPERFWDWPDDVTWWTPMQTMAEELKADSPDEPAAEALAILTDLGLELEEGKKRVREMAAARRAG